MKKYIDLFRFILISPELIVGLIVYQWLNHARFISVFISKYLFPDKADVKLVLFGVTPFILWNVYQFGDDILNPTKDENRKVLKKFPKYWMLKNRIYYSLTLSVMAFIATLFAFYYAYTVDKIYGTIILLTSWSVVSVCFVTVALARLSIKDILY